MRIITLITSSALFLSACGGESTEADSQSNTSQASTKTASTPQMSTPMTKPSGLLSMMTEADVCDVLDIADIKSMFDVTGEISTSAVTFGGTFSCDYSWDRADKEARENNYINHAMLVAQGKAERLPMRQKVTQHQINVSLSEFKGQKVNFVPAQLSEEQLQAQIERAKKAAEDRLTDEQKALAGDAANSMVENMLKKNNQNQAVDGVGDAAYWSKVGMGGLNVLDGTVKVYISPMIADTEAEDIENAKKIAASLLQ